MVYWWADGLYVKAGIEDRKTALLTIMAALSDGSKLFLAMDSGERESKESYAETKKLCEAKRNEFVMRYRCTDKKAVDTLLRDWDGMMSFYSYPKEHWVHLRTTNIVESPFSAVRLRTDASRRFKRVEGARAMFWKLLTVAEKSWRKLTAPGLMKDVYDGKTFTEGKSVAEKKQQGAAAA